jgi:hypothetical protein
MYGKIDVEDAISSSVFSLGAAVSTGIADISVLGYDLSGSVFTLGGSNVQLAAVLSVLALVVAYATNRVYGSSGSDARFETDLSEIMSGRATVETYIAGATLLIILANTFDIMGFNGFVMGSDIVGIVVLAVEAAGFYVFSWMG